MKVNKINHLVNIYSGNLLHVCKRGALNLTEFSYLNCTFLRYTLICIINV